MAEHFTMKRRLSRAEIANWRAHVPPVIEALRADLDRRGLSPDYAPEMPLLKDGLQGYIKQPFRVLMAWIPDWSPNEDAGFHVVRVDTLVKTDA